MVIEVTNNYIYTPSNMYKNTKNITYGYIDTSARSKHKPSGNPTNAKDKVLAGVGSCCGVGLSLAYLMKKQNVNNPFKLKINKVKIMLPMAAMANIGAILLSSIGEKTEDIKKKWKEGAFQMLLTATPMLLVDNSIKLCEKSKNKYINNNLTKIILSALGVYVGSHFALEVSNKLRNEKEAKKPERKLKLVDMVANLDDAVAMMVLVKIPFANKIKIDKLLPLIYLFTGYRAGTGDTRK